jgi:hypothetical protein
MFMWHLDRPACSPHPPNPQPPTPHSHNIHPPHRHHRIELTKHLITEACKQHSQSIAFHFGWRLHKAALEVDSAILWNKHSEQKHAVGYDLLVGADGEDSR